MNRLQKKCVIGTVGIHLLLFLILIVGPAFFNPQPKTEKTFLDVIPANLVDTALNSGVQDATPPPPAQPAPITPADLRPPPPIPQPQPRVVQPAPTPAPSFLDKVKDYLTPPKPTPTVTPDLTPAKKPTKSSTDNIQVNLNKVTRTTPKNSPHTPTPDNSRAINSALKSLKNNLSKATTIDMPGTASASYANYGDVVISVYHHAWVSPDGMASDNVTVKFKVTIARDGTVISASIIESSGDANVDRAVQQMLDRVTVIAPFPEGTDDKQRTYPINFNATRPIE